MNEPIKEAFGQVRASDALRRRTKARLSARLHRRAQPLRAMAMACAMLFAVVCGPWLYMTPTAAISLDVNPSIELNVNRFDRVISVSAYNESGEILREAVDLRHMRCEDAVDAILREPQIAQLLDDGGEMTIAVIGEGAQGDRLLRGMERCAQGRAACYAARREDADAAHAMGLSCGRYRAFTLAQQAHPELTAQDAQTMSMRALREMAGEGAPHGHGNGKHGNWK